MPNSSKTAGNASFSEPEIRDVMMSRALIAQYEISLIEGNEGLKKDYEAVLKLRFKQETLGLRQVMATMKEAEEKAMQAQRDAGTTFVQPAEQF